MTVEIMMVVIMMRVAVVHEVGGSGSDGCKLAWFSH